MGVMDKVRAVLSSSSTTVREVEEALDEVAALARTGVALGREEATRFLSFLLRSFAVDWVECLTAESRARRVDGLFFGKEALLPCTDSVQLLAAELATLAEEQEEARDAAEARADASSIAAQQRQLLKASKAAIDNDVTLITKSNDVALIGDTLTAPREAEAAHSLAFVRVSLQKRTEELLRMLQLLIDPERGEMTQFLHSLQRSETGAGQEGALCEAAVSCLISLPDRVAGVTLRKLPEQFQPRCFCVEVLRQAGSFLECAGSKGVPLVAMICTRLVRSLGQSQAVALQLSLWAGESDSKREAVVSILSAVSEACQESLLFHFISFQLVEHCHSVTALSSSASASDVAISVLLCMVRHRLTGKSGRDASQWIYLVTNKFLQRRQLPVLAQAALLNALFLWDGMGAAGESKLFNKALSTLLTTFSSQVFLETSTEESHGLVARGILAGMQLLAGTEASRAQDIAARTKLSTKLVAAVQNHIGYPNATKRRWGLMVGERLSLFMEAERKLEFDYDHITEEEEAAQFARERLALEASKEKLLLILSNDNAACEEERSKKGRGRDQEVREDQGIGQEPPQIVDSEEESYEDCSDDDYFVPYAIEDDCSDLREVPLPAYMLEVIRLVRDVEEPDSIGAALEAAEGVVRRLPADLEENAVELTRGLLYLQDTFSLEGYTEKRYGALAALVVTCTRPVVQFLTKEFYGNNHTIGHRIDILQVLMMGAKEISPWGNEGDIIAKADPLRAVEMTVGEVEEPRTVERATSKKISYAESMQATGKTRRWSDARKRGEKQSVVRNSFEEVAGEFYFPLVQRYDNKKNTFNLLGQDSVVLGQLIFTVGTIMECCSGITVISQRIGTSILELCLAVRTHPEPYVRKSVAFSMSRVFRRLPGSFLMSEATQSCARSKTWLERMMQNDADKMCREIALAALLCLKSAVEES